ncbi:hypothetical protein NQD34_001802 [Periophthalmus magnuspinnatus]|nr:hypothetical protein NQD34_001802 [Periophthalmus magnuspinnatus]
MTVTLPSGQLSVILAVGLTPLTLPLLQCLSYHFRTSSVYVKLTTNLRGGKEKNKGQSSPTVYFTGKTANMAAVVAEGGGRRRERDLGGISRRRGSPVGLKESYLLLLPITPQSPALSTCKMALDMAVRVLFWR